MAEADNERYIFEFLLLKPERKTVAFRRSDLSDKATQVKLLFLLETVFKLQMTVDQLDEILSGVPPEWGDFISFTSYRTANGKWHSRLDKAKEPGENGMNNPKVSDVTIRPNYH